MDQSGELRCIVRPLAAERVGSRASSRAVRLLRTMIVGHVGHLSTKRVVLASQSPRRREILELLGVRGLVVTPSRFDEDSLRKLHFDSVAEYVKTSARRKAEEVAEREKYDLIIAADTVVVVDGRVLEKPRSEGEAIEYLRMLSARSHQVLTGVAMRTAGGAVTNFVESTHVHFAPLSDDLIAAYVATREPMDKAGAYGIQGMGGSFVTKLNGCYFNVMGLPMHRVAAEIAEYIEAGKL